jgi:rhodanese-related sulfurtransferase
MIHTLKKLLGFGPKTDYAQLVKDGAIIIDVRSKEEYAGGHIQGAINIAVDTLGNNLGKLKDKNKPIITCCASGMRSGVAKNLLKSNGYANVYNGGSWYSLNQKIN